MEATGIICEYNPLHLGHKKQIDAIRAAYPDGGIVCLMSGNYVQRGAAAIIDKSLRAKAAIECGTDLVLELPITASLSSAEGFAREGVRILGGFCQRLCFGAETADKDALLATAQALLREDFPEALHRELDKGLSFPAARQKALEAMGASGDMLSRPNDILATEYCKAILSLRLAMEPMVIAREGGYHDTDADSQNPSATAVRELMEKGESWESYVPTSARAIFSGATIHSLAFGEQAILYRLQTMTDDEFEALPYGNEGLWRKLMQNARTHSSLEDILTATKSRRYTRTRLDRMVMCAFLGITERALTSPAPYVRVLALNDKGRELLKAARETGYFPNAGEAVDHPYQELEYRAGRLYSLFSASAEQPQQEQQRRIFYKSE
ncbi:MAG: nucleotidyltransferase family protein [Oscillospiraceae bacterium]|nr:nucleotidyltransferase family protein [Oscillospiraceae bacterium]MBQ8880696.1 nucleotidyltransferase family protein [Oscillospiraceae bacterium]